MASVLGMPPTMVMTSNGAHDGHSPSSLGSPPADAALFGRLGDGHHAVVQLSTRPEEDNERWQAGGLSTSSSPRAIVSPRGSVYSTVTSKAHSISSVLIDDTSRLISPALSSASSVASRVGSIASSSVPCSRHSSFDASRQTYQADASTSVESLLGTRHADVAGSDRGQAPSTPNEPTRFMTMSSAASSSDDEEEEEGGEGGASDLRGRIAAPRAAHGLATSVAGIATPKALRPASARRPYTPPQPAASAIAAATASANAAAARAAAARTSGNTRGGGSSLTPSTLSPSAATVSGMGGPPRASGSRAPAEFGREAGRSEAETAQWGERGAPMSSAAAAVAGSGGGGGTGGPPLAGNVCGAGLGGAGLGGAGLGGGSMGTPRGGARVPMLELGRAGVGGGAIGKGGHSGCIARLSGRGSRSGGGDADSVLSAAEEAKRSASDTARRIALAATDGTAGRPAGGAHAGGREGPREGPGAGYARSGQARGAAPCRLAGVRDGGATADAALAAAAALPEYTLSVGSSAAELAKRRAEEAAREMARSALSGGSPVVMRGAWEGERGERHVAERHVAERPAAGRSAAGRSAAAACHQLPPHPEEGVAVAVSVPAEGAVVSATAAAQRHESQPPGDAEAIKHRATEFAKELADRVEREPRARRGPHASPAASPSAAPPSSAAGGAAGVGTSGHGATRRHESNAVGRANGADAGAAASGARGGRAAAAPPQSTTSTTPATPPVEGKRAARLPGQKAWLLTLLKPEHLHDRQRSSARSGGAGTGTAGTGGLSRSASRDKSTIIHPVREVIQYP